MNLLRDPESSSRGLKSSSRRHTSLREDLVGTLVLTMTAPALPDISTSILGTIALATGKSGKMRASRGTATNICVNREVREAVEGTHSGMRGGKGTRPISKVVDRVFDTRTIGINTTTTGELLIATRETMTLARPIRLHGVLVTKVLIVWLRVVALPTNVNTPHRRLPGMTIARIPHPLVRLCESILTCRRQGWRDNDRVHLLVHLRPCPRAF
jgi:hypothetical protein